MLSLSDISTRRLLVLAIAGTIVMRLAVLFVTPMNDEASYEQLIIARNAVSGKGFGMAWPYPPVDSVRAALWASETLPHPSAFMPPFVPAFYTMVYAATGPTMTGVYTGLIIQCLLGGLVPWLVFRIGRRLTTDRAGAYAALVSMAYVPGLISSATPSGAIWYGVGALFVIDTAQQVYHNGRRPLLLGLAAGMLTLMRSEFLFVGILLCMAPLLQRRWRPALLSIACMMCVIAPWMIRNTIVMNRPTGIVSHPWREIWRGANERASGSGYDADGWLIWEGPRFPEIVRKLDSVPVTASFELDADAVFRDAVIDYAQRYPQEWMALSLKKLVMLWTIDPYYPKARNIAYIGSTLFTSAMIVWGVFLAIGSLRRARVDGALLLPLLMIGILLSVAFMLTYLQPRYQTYVFTAMFPAVAFVMQRMIRYNSERVRLDR
ncbi:MAG: hypothetical protein FGM24_01135 [Candidatus Kapabacteria bacterium]|nr:hypothetical protein [Candidatus Kapabacteria bacterium]